jgi:hypothetical protein
MNSRVPQILGPISAIETELQTAVKEQKAHLHYQLEGKRITFEHAVKEAHVKAKLGMFQWLKTVRPQNYLTAPVIYCMIVPLLLLDLSMTFYQWTCFSIYGISKVARANYFVLDHQHLAYLNLIEKVDCLYCSYATGLLAYSSEIAARTEQYFCPIKHARKILGEHARYAHFLEYGDADNFHGKIEVLRGKLAKEDELRAKGDSTL